MEEMILISKSRYFKMMESYDQAVKELEEIKKALEEAATSKRASNPTTQQKAGLRLL